MGEWPKMQCNGNAYFTFVQHIYLLIVIHPPLWNEFLAVLDPCLHPGHGLVTQDVGGPRLAPVHQTRLSRHNIQGNR